MGTFYDLTKKYQDPVWNVVWKSSDQPATPVNVHVYADIFGTNEPVDNGGGTYTILPVVAVAGASLSELEDILSQWKCPAKVAVNRDQRGYGRNVNTSMGAVDVNSAVGLGTISKNAKTLIQLSADRYLIEGVKNIWNERFPFV